VRSLHLTRGRTSITVVANIFEIVEDKAVVRHTLMLSRWREIDSVETFTIVHVSIRRRVSIFILSYAKLILKTLQILSVFLRR
jgi:hypothetical protein